MQGRSSKKVSRIMAILSVTVCAINAPAIAAVCQFSDRFDAKKDQFQPAESIEVVIERHDLFVTRGDTTITVPWTLVEGMYVPRDVLKNNNSPTAPERGYFLLRQGADALLLAPEALYTGNCTSSPAATRR